MSCFIKIDFERAKALKGLYDYCGSNCSQFYSYLTTVIKNINSEGELTFTPEFKVFWKSKNPLDINTTPTDELKDAIIKFFNNKYPTVDDGVRDTKQFNKIKTFGYTSVGAREEAKRHFVNKMMAAYNDNENLGNEKVTENLKAYYTSYARILLSLTLARRLSKITGVDEETIYSNLAEDNNSKYVQDLIADKKDKINIQLENLIALYNEYNSTDLYKAMDIAKPENAEAISPRLEFIDEIMNDSRLMDIRLDKSESLEDSNADNAQDENDENDDTSDTDTQTKNSTYDTYIKILDNKLGVYTTFMTHVGAPLRMLLGSLPKMTTSEESDGKYVLDTDNYLGIADVMDANFCASVLYHYGRYDNPTEMMKSIKDIANRLPGFAAFHKLYNILNEDENLQISFYRTFSKVAISKLETVVEDDESKTRITNGGLNRTDVLKFKFENALKGTSLSVVPRQRRAEYGKLITDIESSTVSDSNLRVFCDKLAEQLKVYYPTIDNLTIRNYVLLNADINGNINTKENLLNLAKQLEETIKAAEKTEKNYKNIESSIAVARNHNYKVNQKIKQGLTTTETTIDLNPLYAEGYIDKSAKAVTSQLAKMLANYALIDAPLNSRNVKGNQSSDIINSSMMTAIKNILESQLNSYKEVVDKDGNKKIVWDKNAPIVRLGEHRFQSKQYDFSNILLEHKDEKGNIINYGLFYEDVDKKGKVTYIPTEYSTQLLQIRLYDGASNLDDGTSSLYANMSKGDYIGTAWRNFFKSANSIKSVDNSADYFMRIPSDAPKTFSITAPRYKIDGLLNKANEAAIRKEITNFIKEVSNKTVDSLNDARFNSYPIVVKKDGRILNVNDFVNHLQTTEEKRTNIRIPINKQSNLKDNKTKTIKIAFRYSQTDADKNSDNVYIMEGTYYDGTLHNAKFVGFNKTNVNDEIWNDIRKNIELRKNKLSVKDGGYDWNINVNHPIFKQLVNVFTQELTDMATAATVMFETVRDRNTGNYRIKVDSNGHPILIKKSDIVKGNTDHNGLHPVYHFADPNDDGKGEIFTVDKNGDAHLTGKVFTSDRFILYDYFAEEGEEPIKNYGEDILNEAFSLFKKRTTDSNQVLQFDKAGNIILSDTQKTVIENNLKRFILDYIEHARHRMSDYEGFVKNIEHADTTTENIADFILNTHLTYVGFNDIFEGDTKFYKNTQTFLKRAKESQGSGVPYGFVDFTKPLLPPHAEINSVLDTEFPNLNIRMQNTFSAITVYNTVRTDVPMLETLVSTLTNKDVMGDKVLTEDAARTLLYGPIKMKNGQPVIKNGQVVRSGGYQDTTVNNAQSYITFKEWVRRITARGQLPKYKDLINRILDEKTPLTVDDITEFVQVQKNFYYDQYYNEKTKTISPRQIKNAEFVLVPRLIAGTELEKVAKLMDRLGVDQLNTTETSKAGQSERFTLWDSTGHISQEILDDIDNPNGEYKSEIMSNGAAAKEYYSYNYLYTQQETPQHINDENKAGIQVLKKLFDNIDDNSPEHLRRAKEKFFDIYSANIKDSFLNLMKRFKVETDENGNIIVDKNNKIKGLDYTEFFAALKEELIRLGVDRNLIDYCTQDKNSPDPSQTIMPNYFSLVGPKFENIVQSIFNNAITRQTLPGFHAAQITGMGFRKLSEQVDKSRTSNILQYHPQLYKNKETEQEITEREYNLLSKEDKKQYQKSRVANYVEIMLPASNFGFKRNSEAANKVRQAALDAGKSLKEAEEAVDHMFLTQLQHEHLDEIIGYRIPTEGKQSVCCMKVVGFTNDAYGSTIVVPDAWVSQTGSDFDIDSVYGIQYKTYFDKNGQIKASRYKENKKELYQGYVFRYLNEEEIVAAFEEAKASEATIQQLKEQYRNPDGTFNKEGFIESLKDYSKLALEGVIEDIAEEKGLQSYEEFSKQDVELLNSKAARDNEILNIFKEVLIDSASLEENLSRSNFDDIIAALDKCIVGDTNIQRKARTAYNIFDQAEYQEDAMSGARLKAFSVTRDTFCSICNTLHPKLENYSSIKVFYSADKYTEKELIARFGEFDKDGKLIRSNVSSSTGGFIVTHRTFGWTNDNKNVDGKILTAYSSQTTAHILDAIKSGNVPNVNDLTFQVYKTIVDIGSNYDTAISFIMQPGIHRIVEAYNKTNSIYSEERGRNYVLTAVRSILDDLNLEYDYSQSVDDLLAIVNSNYGDLAETLFGEGFEFSAKDSMNEEIALNSNLQIDRLSDKGIFGEDSPVEGKDAENLKLLYDLQNIIQYSKIDKLANNIREAARVSNPDKFGAKQTIFATREIFDNILSSINNNQNDNNESTFRLQVNGKHLLTELYPGVDNFTNVDDVLNYIISSPDFVKCSKYKPLAAFLKYSTATSIKINKTLFVTQNDDFIKLILGEDDSLASKLSNGNRVSEKVAKDFQNYLINYIVLQSEFLQAPLHYSKGRGGNRGFEYIGKAPRDYNESEAIRVFGYGHSPALVAKKEYKENNTTVNVYTGDITPDDKNTIFVFGSNPIGVNGILDRYGPGKDSGGAAAFAQRYFGVEAHEQMDNRLSNNGRAYGLVTVTRPGAKRSLSPAQITENVKKLYEVARQHPNKKFKIAYRNVGNETTLNGYSGNELIDMFVAAGTIPENVYFSKEWVDSGKLDNVFPQELETKHITEPFTVEDINNPTQDEINDFNTMSPAQKVTWIKRHFRDAGVFKYIDTTLFNEYSTRGRKAGTQTLEFNENATDIETVYNEFEKAFTNKNPLVACAAADVVKYAFFVEGYRMGMGNVSKMIPNTVLTNGGRIYGTNIVNNTNDKIKSLDTFIKGNTANMILENFIRSHVNSIGIDFHNVRQYKGGYEILRRDQNLIQINTNTKEGKDLAEKYDIIYKGKDGITYYPNEYVRLGFGKDKILYRITEGSPRNYFLIPLNTLDINENATWSANAQNNKYPSPDFYENIINNYISRIASIRTDSEETPESILKEELKAGNKIANDYRSSNDFSKAKKVSVPIGDMNTNPVYSDLIKEISDWYKNSITENRPIKFVWNIPLSKSIKDFGADNGTVQRLVLKDGSIETFRIYKFNASNPYINLIKNYTGKNIDREIVECDKVYTEAIELLRKVASYNSDNYVPPYFGDIYAIEPIDLDVADNDDGINSSSMLDVAVESTASIYRRSYDPEDKDAIKIAQEWKELGIEAKRATSENPEDYTVNVHLDNIFINTAKYIENRTKALENKLKHYTIDPETGNYVAVNDVKCIKQIKKDPKKRREYFKTLAEAQAIVREFGLIKELDIDSTDSQMQQYLKKMKESVERIQNLPIVADAYEKFAKEYYDKITDNPNVKEGFMSVLDGFNKTNWFNAMFNDIQETSNPIIQLAMKNFQADLRAKQFDARKRSDEFIKHIEDIKHRAEAAGERFDLSKVIDEYGRFRQTYNNRLLEDRNRLKKAVNDAIKETHYGSVEHLKAKLEYDEWKAAHLEQEVVKEYYDEKNKLLRSMLYPNTQNMTEQAIAFSGINRLPQYLSKYETLRIERAKLRNKYQSDVEDAELDKKLEALDVAIQELHYANDGDDEATYYLKERLHKYILNLRDLEGKYFKYDSVYNFDALVEENLRIVESYENSGQAPALYANNSEYIKAKTWLRRNVSIEPVLTEEVKEELENAYNVLRGAETRVKYKAIRYNKKYINKYGDFDPRLIPDNEIEKLRKDQEDNYNLSNEHPFSDRTLINNSNPNNEIYSKEFYNGMRSDESKTLNPKWQETVTKINDILYPYYNEYTKEIDLESIPREESKLVAIYGKEFIDAIKLKHKTTADVALIKELRSLYDSLRDIRGDKKSATTKKFIKENVKFDYNKEKYNADKLWIKGLSKDSFRSALLDLIQDIDYDDNVVPNSFMYGFARPKDNKLDKFTDVNKTKALETINKYKEKKLRDSYYEARYEARHGKSDEEYENWIKRNHIYNPFTHAYEPIAIWWNTVDKSTENNYYPKFPQTVRTVRDGYFTHKEALEQLENYDEEEFPSVRELEQHYFAENDYRNKNYKPGVGHAGNYITGSDEKYNNNIDANNFELEAMHYMQDILNSLTNTQDSKKFIEKGWLPARRKSRPNNVEGWTKELLKVVGWNNDTYENDDWYDDIDYSKDRPNPMPMLERLKGKGYKEIPKRPIKEKNQSDADYAVKLDEWEKKKAQIEKDNLEIHKALLDNDWVDVIAEFIVRAGTYNAVQDSKYELFYAQELIKKYGSYIIKYDNKGNLRFKKNIRTSGDSDAEYLRKPDKYLIEQWDNQLRRILYDQFKSPNNPKLKKWMRTLQGITSAQYMMLNVKGGIANVTLGESSIIAEAFAKEFFGGNHYLKAKAYYGKSIYDYILHSLDDKAGTVAGAIIKFMDIVDYDEHSGVSKLTKDAYEVLRKSRDLGYTPQTAGEHEMQNSAMFAMMMSHRIFNNERANEFGQPKYKVMNLAEYIRSNHEKALLSILTDEEIKQYKKFKETVSADANEFKEFSWYQKDFTTEFAMKLDYSRQKEFIKQRDELDKQSEEQFNDDSKHPTLLSQLDVDDNTGKMIIAKDSMLSEIDNPNENGEPSDALKLLASFKGRVISVNKYIHGAYDKSGRAQIESTLFGSIFMQYHKHLPIGIMKRFRSQGMYSEERGAVTKGMYRSLYDYLKIPFRKYYAEKQISEDEYNALESFKAISKNIIDFALHFNLAYQLLPEYDRANFQRMKNSIYTILATVALTIAVKAGADDDDEDSLLYNLALYEADRLATEAGQYFPPIAYTEAKKLWQSPIAAGSGITDLLSSLNLICHMIIEGDEFDGEYRSGKFAGESKLKVYIERRIPIWRGIKSSFIDIKSNNRFYKIGDNMLNFIDTDEYAEKIKNL